MGRWLMLAAMLLVIIGGLMTFEIPFSWIGTLPGDISIHWNNIRLFLPITTSLAISFVLSILFSLFARY